MNVGPTRHDGCPFCDRIEAGNCMIDGPVAWFEPLNPVTPGHLLFVPSYHAEHPDPTAVGAAMSAAETYAYINSATAPDWDLITSSGRAATQTVPHLHVHYVPRQQSDGLHLPWTGQPKADPSC